MPIEYAGALAGARAVRERVGLFDLTHLGKVEVTGPGALGMLQRVVTNDLSRAAVGEALYNLVLNEGGGVIEDLIVYRLDDERYFVVPNAANAHRVLQILEETPADVPRAPDVSPGLVLPRGAGTRVGARDAASCSRRPSDLAFMQCVETEYRRRPVIVTRSGLHGRGRVRAVHVPGRGARCCGRRCSRTMGPFGGAPCGLAARDVLRLEMGYPLYGQDLFESVTALEAGLSWAVSFDKGDFRGRDVAARQRDGRAAEPARGPAHAGAAAHPTGALPRVHRATS